VKKDYLNAIDTVEYLNNEMYKLVNSPKMKIGEKILLLKERTIKENITKRLKTMKMKEHDRFLYDYNKTEEERLSERTFSGNKDIKIAVYTGIFGNYDAVKEPIFIKSNIDYYIFTEGPVNSQVWIKKEMPSSFNKQDYTLKNRYLKFHPFELFPDYDYVIYIDGNVTVTSDLSGLLNNLNENGISFHSHANRVCLYSEIEALITAKKGIEEKLLEQVKYYKNEGFPTNYGLLEATVIVTDNKNQVAKKILLEWWEEFLRSGSMRDQVSLPYILWKNGISVNKVNSLGKNVYRSLKFRVVNH